MFSERAFDDVLGHYPRAHWIMSDVRTAARSARGVTFEQKLAELQESKDRDIQAAMAQVPFALHSYFRMISRDFTSQAINYAAVLARFLLREINVAFGSLNYDTLLDQTIEQATQERLAHQQYRDYEGRWLLAKLHGSADWGYRWVDNYADHLERSLTTGEPITDLQLLRLHGRAEARRDEVIGDAGLDLTNLQTGRRYYPALALPVEGKYGFVCPTWTERALGEAIAKSTGLLFIGFSGHDKDVLDLLGAHVGKSVQVVHFVGYKDAEEVGSRVLAGVLPLASLGVVNEQSYYNDGFTAYLQDAFDDFLDEVLDRAQ
jgi:hypothetical protein